MADVKLRIREYRELSGMTQQVLGEKLGVVRQTIAAWEKGDSAPTLAQLFRLADILGVQVDLLLGQPHEDAPGFLFRADEPSVLSPELVSILTRRASDYASIERILGAAPLLPESRPLDAYEPDTVEVVARETRNWLGVHDGPLCHVPSLLEDKGLKIILHPMPSEVSGLSAYSDELGGVVFVNSRHPVERRSFTALHEMAHLVFHRQDYQERAGDKRRNDPREKAANHFAGAVLLPKEAITKELANYRGRWIPEPLLEDIKQRYQVSMRTILLRAEETGLISRQQAGKQLGVLNKRYGPQGEPGMLSEPQVLTRFRRLVFEALLAEKITMSRAAEILGLSLVDVRSAMEKWIDGGAP